MAKAPDATAVAETEGSTAGGARRSPAPAAAPRAGRGFPSATARGGRVNSLDGLRTLAVALVLAYHVDHTLLPGGSVAVDVFFTISGFVITRLLLAEYARTGTLALRAFYRRRWLRLVPALLALCAVCVVLATTTSLWSFEGSWQAAGLAAAFVTNVVRAMDSGTYAGGPLAHTWSLAVEEQFYLLWPLLMLFLLRRLRARTVLLCTVALCVLPFLWRCVLWNPDAAHRIYNGTDTRADQLLAGALVAVALARLRADDPRLELLRTWAGRLAGPALALLALVAWQVPITEDNGIWTALWYTAGFLGVAVASATLVAGLELQPDAWLSCLLSWEPLAWVGRNLSYGIYLWHYPVVRLLASLGVQDGRLTATAVLTVTMALVVLPRGEAVPAPGPRPETHAPCPSHLIPTPGTQPAHLGIHQRLPCRVRPETDDNAMAEAMNGSFKAEPIEMKGRWTGFDQVERAIFPRVTWYNEERLHPALDYVPPAEYERAFWRSQEQAPQSA